jgi:hypothetical protein
MRPYGFDQDTVTASDCLSQASGDGAALADIHGRRRWTIAVGLLDGEATKRMSALANRLAAANARVRLELVEVPSARDAACMAILWPAGFRSP